MRCLPILVVHAGAGEWGDDGEAALAACSQALQEGISVLDARDGTAIDAVAQAVRVLEADPVCNAGTGGVLTSTGDLELDASIMEGSSLRSGAVGALPPFEHPVDVARAVLEDGRYHLLTGEGAALFAQAHGFSRAEPAKMITERRRDELDEARHTGGNTVGAVARDREGRLASATSTGGVSGTEPGRIGDTAIVGAGTYANDLAACSCTGDGEAFTRACAAFHCVESVGIGAQRAGAEEVERVKSRFGGQGGLIVLDRDGEVGVARTMPAMPHGIVRAGDDPTLAL